MNIRGPWRLAALVSTLTLAFAYVGPATAADDEAGRKLEDTPRMTVRGEAELRKPADQVRLSVAVETEAADARAALDENNTRMRTVVEALEKAGLDETEYETGRFQIRPQYARRPRQPAADWKPKIVGYQVTNTIVIRTSKLEETGTLIQTASQAGANAVEVAGFDLADARTHRAEAIATATRNAIADAGVLAEAAGLRLVRIVHLTLDQVPTPRTDAGVQMRAMAEASAAPPITPGDVTVRAGVAIVYEIAPAE